MHRDGRGTGRPGESGCAMRRDRTVALGKVLHRRYSRLFWAAALGLGPVHRGSWCWSWPHNRYGFLPWVVLFLTLTWASTLFFSRFAAGREPGRLRFAQRFRLLPHPGDVPGDAVLPAAVLLLLHDLPVLEQRLRGGPGGTGRALLLRHGVRPPPSNQAPFRRRLLRGRDLLRPAVLPARWSFTCRSTTAPTSRRRWLSSPRSRWPTPGRSLRQPPQAGAHRPRAGGHHRGPEGRAVRWCRRCPSG